MGEKVVLATLFSKQWDMKRRGRQGSGARWNLDGTCYCSPCWGIVGQCVRVAWGKEQFTVYGLQCTVYSGTLFEKAEEVSW